jgi:hypothetical protein
MSSSRQFTVEIATPSRRPIRCERVEDLPPLPEPNYGLALFGSESASGTATLTL